MEAFRLLRQQSIERLGTASDEEFSEAAVALWEGVAGQIIAIVGEAGFDSLYARSVFLAQSTYPWIIAPPESATEVGRLVNLRANLEAVQPGAAREANRLLLTIFTDTLASLIGEPLTERLLHSAWGNLPHQENQHGREHD
jgi:hypothetical protein